MFISVVFFAMNPVIGLAANIGSGVFQFMPVIGIPALFSKQPLSVDKYEVIRSVIYYAFTLILLAIAVSDGNLNIVELLAIIFLWIIFMYWTIMQRPKLRIKR